VQATQTATVPAAQDQVVRILSDRHRIKNAVDVDFETESLGDQLTTFNQILDLFTCSPPPSPWSRWLSVVSES
jgi:hypothetical protein